MKNLLFKILLALSIILFYSCKTIKKDSAEFQDSDLNVRNLDSIANMLEIVYVDDQDLRQDYQQIEKEYGWDSEQAKELWNKQNKLDSINLIKVTSILEKYGWLGIDEVGEEANSALFLVLQHSDINTQLKYMPILEKATEIGKATKSEFAYFKDRVLLRQGKKQIYGTQYEWDAEKEEYYLWSVVEPEKLNERRASVGIPPIEEYYENFLKREWNLSEYLKRIERIEQNKK